MRVVYLNENDFDNFSKLHPLHSFYQTSNYGNLMKNLGHEIIYYGFFENDKMIGATLIILQDAVKNYKYAYAPRGILMNYDNIDEVSSITRALRKLLNDKGVAFLKIDPLVIYKIRDDDGQILPFQTNEQLITNLTNLGYNYFGPNKFFGTLKPRWNAFLKLGYSSDQMLANMDKNARNKINKAKSRGVEVYQGTFNDINLFYQFVAKKHHRNLNYYNSLAQCFGKNFEIYFVKLNTEAYLKNIQKIYENEQLKNEKINFLIQKSQNAKSKNKQLNKKMESDRLLAIFKREIVFATNLLMRNPDGLIIGATSIIKDSNNIHMLIEGLNPKFKTFYPTFLANWYVINKYSQAGYSFYDLNAVTGDFTENNKFKGLNEMKLSFGSMIYEFIGEFDLVLSPNKYAFYRKVGLSQRMMKNKTK